MGKEAVAKLAALALILACSSGPTRNGTSERDAGAMNDGGISTHVDGTTHGASDVRGMSPEVRSAEAGTARDLPVVNDGRDATQSDTRQDAVKSFDVVIVVTNSAAVDGGGQAVRDGMTIEANSGVSDGPIGGSDLALPRPGTCANPIPISLSTMRTEIHASNVGAEHLFDIPCAQNGADVVYSISVQDAQLVYADTFGSSWDTVLFFSDTCPPADKADEAPDGLARCNDDACATSQSQAIALLAYGRHYLVLSGAHGESGEATIHLDRTLAGGGTLLPVPAGTGALAGTTSGVGNSALCEAGGPEDTYWWSTCPDFEGGDFLATTCAGSSFDTVLALQIPRSGVVACNDDDDACGRQSTVGATLPPGAGLYSLLVDGQVGTSAGDYTLAYTRP